MSFQRGQKQEVPPPAVSLRFNPKFTPPSARQPVCRRSRRSSLRWSSHPRSGPRTTRARRAHLTRRTQRGGHGRLPGLSPTGRGHTPYERSVSGSVRWHPVRPRSVRHSSLSAGAGTDASTCQACRTAARMKTVCRANYPRGHGDAAPTPSGRRPPPPVFMYGPRVRQMNRSAQGLGRQQSHHNPAVFPSALMMVAGNAHDGGVP